MSFLKQKENSHLLYLLDADIFGQSQVNSFLQPVPVSHFLTAEGH